MDAEVSGCFGEGGVGPGCHEAGEPLSCVWAGQRFAEDGGKRLGFVDGAEGGLVAGSAAWPEGNVVGVGPTGHVRGAHACFAGEVRQSSAAVDVLLDEPVPFGGAAALVVPRALAERDAVLLGEVGQHSAGEAGEGGDLPEGPVFVEVELSEALCRDGLPGLLPVALAAFFVSGGAGAGCSSRTCRMASMVAPRTWAAC